MYKKILFLTLLALGLRIFAHTSENISSLTSPSQKNQTLIDGLDQSINEKQEEISRVEKSLFAELSNFNQEELDTLQELIKNTQDYTDSIKEMVIRRLSKLNKHIEECTKKHGTDHMNCMLPLWTEGTFYHEYKDKNPCYDQDEKKEAKLLEKKVNEFSNINKRLTKKCSKCEIFIQKIDKTLIPLKHNQSQNEILKKYTIEHLESYNQNSSGKMLRFTEKNLYEANKENVEYLDSFLQKVMEVIQKKKEENR